MSPSETNARAVLRMGFGSFVIPNSVPQREGKVLGRVLDFGIAKATNLPGSIQSGALTGNVSYAN